MRKLLNLLLILSISAVSINAFARCLYSPIEYWGPGCSVANLTITSISGSAQLYTDWKCNQTVDITQLEFPPQVKFTTLQMTPTRNQTYFMAMLDKTSNQLLWMVSNMTQVNTIIAPGRYPWYGSHSHSITLRGYQRPILNATSNNHSIEFLVFEERNPGFIRLSPADYDIRQRFDFRNWIQRQTSSGVIFCGPVGGGEFRVNQKFFAPYPTQPQPYVPSRTNPPPIYPNQNPSENEKNFFYPNYPNSKGFLRKNNGVSIKNTFKTIFAFLFPLLYATYV